MESKLRILIQKLEITLYVQNALPYPKVFPNPEIPTGFTYPHYAEDTQRRGAGKYENLFDLF